MKVYIADCNNHCIRRVWYDEGIVESIKIDHPEAGDTESTGILN